MSATLFLRLRAIESQPGKKGNTEKMKILPVLKRALRRALLSAKLLDTSGVSAKNSGEWQSESPRSETALHIAAATNRIPAREDRLKAADACGHCHTNPQDDFNMLGLLYRPGGNLEAHAPFVGYHYADLEAPGNEAKRAIMEGSFGRTDSDAV